MKCVPPSITVNDDAMLLYHAGWCSASRSKTRGVRGDQPISERPVTQRVSW
jgi:hypothetical protein